jgi:hypothetical protein
MIGICVLCSRGLHDLCTGRLRSDTSSRCGCSAQSHDRLATIAEYLVGAEQSIYERETATLLEMWQQLDRAGWGF